MKVLFIFDDGVFSSFFVYDLQNKGTLWRISPEILLHNITLGELQIVSCDHHLVIIFVIILAFQKKCNGLTSLVKKFKN